MSEPVLFHSTSKQDLHQRQQQSVLIKEAPKEFAHAIDFDTATTIQATARILETDNAESDDVGQRYPPSPMTTSPAQMPKAVQSKEAIVVSTLPASPTLLIMHSTSITARTLSLPSKQQKTKKDQRSVAEPTVNDTTTLVQTTTPVQKIALPTNENQPHHHHIQYSNKHSHRLHHHHHGHQQHWHNHSQSNHQRSSSNTSNHSGHSEKKKKRRFSYSKVGVAASHNSVDASYTHLPHNTLPVTHITPADPSGIRSHNNKMNNGSLGLLVDPTPKCCKVRVPPAGLKISPNQKASHEHNNDIGICAQTEELSHSREHSHQHHQHQYPRVCKMVERHPAVKLEWKVPETIKAAGEFLRGVLVVSAKELPETEMKKVAAKSAFLDQQQYQRGETQKEDRHMKKKLKYDRLIRVEHVEIDLTGIEQVTTGGGILSRTRTDHHCFLHKTKVLPIEDFKCIQDAASPSGPTFSTISAASTISSIYSSSTAPTNSSISPSSPTTSVSSFQCRDRAIARSPPSPTSAVTYSFQPGCVVPGTRQGITFQMRVPEKVGGVFKSAHASICYQLTANVHIRIGRESFVLQHPMPVSLFELVQIRAATKIASPHDLSPAKNTSNSVKRSSVRFVIPKANSVLGTAAVRPYSLWGLGPATSSHSSNYQYSNSHGYRKYHSHNSHRQHHNTAPNVLAATYASVPTKSDQLQNGTGDTTLAVKRIRFQDVEIACQEDQMTRPKHCARQASLDGSIDEVGFGAHIDKSVAAAGDNVTLEMFVVKSDLMRVVDIKVSLVETINTYSVLDAHDSAGYPVRKLVETHVVKIAKDYVPAQAEENHANDNHLKGYYEDYEDFRTTKSLSMYKLGMHIPETALTILDRELLKVDYMFVIKFFFKGRIGAFLELPIEIISQYNHNRISTISGAISCVTNSVQIALPPVPILIKRPESIYSDLDKQSVELIVRTASAPSSYLGSIKDSYHSLGHSIGIEAVSNDGDQDGREKSAPEVKTEGISEDDPASEKILTSLKMPTKGIKTGAGADSTAVPESAGVASDRCDEVHVKKIPSKTDLVPKIVVNSEKTTLPDSTSSITGQDTKTTTTTLVTPALPLLFDLTSAVQPSPTIDSVTSPSSVSLAGSRRSSSSSELSPSVQSLYSRQSSISSQLTAPSESQSANDDGPVISSNTSGIMDPVLSNINNGLVAKLAKSFSSSPLLRSRGPGFGISSSPNGSSSNMTGLVSPQQQQSSAFTLAATTLSALTLLSSVGQAVSPVSESVAGNNARRAHTFPHPSHPHQQQHYSPPRPLKSCLRKKRPALPSGINTMSAIQQNTNGGSYLSTKKVSFAKGFTPSPSPTGSQVLFTEAELTSGPGNRASGAPNGAGKITSHKLTPMAAIQNVPVLLPKTEAFKIPSSDASSSNAAVSPRSGRALHPFDGHPNRLSTLDKQHLDHQILREQHRHGQQRQPQQQFWKPSVHSPGLRQGTQESVAAKELELHMEEEEEVEDEDDDGCDELDDDEDEDEDDEQHETEEERIERRRLARVAWLAKYGDAFKQVYGAVPELPPI